LKKSLQPEKKLAGQQLKNIYEWMLRSRILEERLIRMYKQNDGYFWIGGPGEEAFNVSLALQIKKGQGVEYDFLHLHYRSAAIMMVLGIDPKDAMRQMKNTALDPFSGGRNFSNHFSKKEWNVVPITSTIETQYATAIGSGIAHKKYAKDAITIVTGGDAGTAEGEFASCLIWASRPKEELPLLMVVHNNGAGISTPSTQVHAEQNISDRAKAFGIAAKTINGNDVQEAYFEIQQAMQYVRSQRKPFLLEAKVSRLYGHSSATGCNFATQEQDCLAVFEKTLVTEKIFSEDQIKTLREQITAEYLELSQQVKKEPLPAADTIYDFVYAQQKGRYW
jgi:2-oxoisovalerate dehydrogenase E1 component alpha subunit